MGASAVAYVPTAMQNSGDGQEIAFISPSPAAGEGTTDHEPPSQRSNRETAVAAPESGALKWYPTAMQKLDDAQDTPVSSS